MTIFNKIWIMCMVAITVAGFTTACFLYGETGKDYTPHVITSIILGFLSLLLPAMWEEDDLPMLALSSLGFMGNLTIVSYLVFLATR